MDLRNLLNSWAAATLAAEGHPLIAGGALDHDSIVYDVHDCVVYPLTADSGASPAYGTGVDVPGIFSIGFNPNVVSQELKGDARVLDRRARVDAFNFSATYSKLSLDVLDVIFEATLEDTGSGATEVAKLTFEGGNEPPYFGIVVQLEDTDVDIGAIRLIVWKAKVTGGTLVTSQSDTYGQPTFEAAGIATDSHNKMARLEFHETEADIPLGTFPA